MERFPRSQKFLLGDRMQRTVLDALLEATYTRQRGQPLTRANLGSEKLRVLVRLAHDLRVLDRRRYEHAARCLDETGGTLGAWSKNSGAYATSRAAAHPSKFSIRSPTWSLRRPSANHYRSRRIRWQKVKTPPCANWRW